MIRRTIARLVALAAVTLGLLGADAAAATPPVTGVSGTYVVTSFGETTCVPLDPVRLRCRTSGLQSSYEGSLVGASTADFEQLIDCRAGRTVGHGVETFTGSLDGRTGTLAWRLAFTAAFDCTTFFPGNLRLIAVLTHSSDDLAGTVGALVFDDSAYRGVLL